MPSRCSRCGDCLANHVNAGDFSPGGHSNFIGGLHAVGSRGQGVTSAIASYLFLAVNDINLADNGGHFNVRISAIPEPASMIMIAFGLVAVALAARRKRA